MRNNLLRYAMIWVPFVDCWYAKLNWQGSGEEDPSNITTVRYRYQGMFRMTPIRAAGSGSCKGKADLDEHLSLRLY